MPKTFLASVADADCFVSNGGNLIHAISAKTLTESTLGFTSTMEEVRAGIGGKLYGRFNHTTGMTVTLTDAMFDIDYIKYQIGAQDITDGNTALYHDKQFTGAEIKAADGVTLTEAPQAFGESCGLEKIAVWFRPVGCNADSDEITVIAGQNETTVSGKKLTLGAEDKAKFNDATRYCATYFHTASDATAIKVLAEFNPAEMILIMTANLYAGDANNPESGTKYGTFTVKVPRFQLDGAFDLSMAMTSAATFALNGTALAVDDGTCEGKGVYAEIVVAPDGAVDAKSFKMIAIDPETAKVGEVPVVYGIKTNGSVAKLNNDDLDFDGKVGAAGTFTTAGEGTVSLGDLTDTYTVTE